METEGFRRAGKRKYPLRVARTASGIRAQDLRTLARGAWWSRRWIAALEAMRMGPRLGRGRQYAVSGQVTELVLDGPRVEASVTGSRPEPYRVTFDFTALSDAGRARLENTLRNEVMLLARLLTDDLPTEIPELFRAEGVPFFPEAAPRGTGPDGKPVWDVRMRCTCPDWARPCKHMAAVLLLLGEEAARRPATLLALRGLDIDELLPEETAPASLDDFPLAPNEAWKIDGEAAPFVKRLGPVPFWRGAVRSLDALTRIQTRVRPAARAAAEGQSIDLR